MFCKPPHPVYIVLFRGDDTDFVGNQEIIVKITTERNISGCKAYFKYMGNIQTFDEIPENKELHLVFSHEQTKEMPLGTWDAELYLIDENGKRMTVNNRIHMLVTNSVGEAYCPDDPQAVSVVISANKYIEDAEVSADGKTLTLTKKDGTEVSFSGGGGGGGGGGTNDYNDLENKPSINGATLTGNVNLATPEQLSSKADLVDGKVPADQLPSYVDDVLEYDSVSAFPSTGEDGKIYVAKDTNKTYRWGGTQYVEISQSLALGETAETAYPGDKGKAAAELADSAYTVASQAMHDTTVHAENKKNPHAVTAAQVGAVALNARSTVGPLFSVKYTAETGEGDDFSFGIGNGPSGKTFLADKLYCSGKNRFFTDGIVIVNGTSAKGASILDKITEYGGDFKSALTEVKGLIKAYAATMESLAPEYSPSSAYAVGAFVYHDGNIYQCTTAIADGGEAWNAAHWELRKLDDFFTESNSLLTATIDARLPYPLYAVPSTGLLKDRTLNTTSLASVTVPSNFTDLLIRASVTSSLSVTMPDAIATKYGDTFPGEAGEYLITITKTGAAEAYVRTIKLEAANA